MNKLSTAVCVYCGSSAGKNPVWIEAASQLGAGLAERGIDLVYGGGSVGMMGAVADSTLAGGGNVIGVIPKDLQDREKGNQAATELHVVSSMHERKLLMAQKSDAFVVMPGGLGTLDETFEILTWRQLRFHNKPIILADIADYWAPLFKLLHEIIEEGFADPAHLSLLTAVDSVAGIFDALDGLEQFDQKFETSKV